MQVLRRLGNFLRPLCVEVLSDVQLQNRRRTSQTFETVDSENSPTEARSLDDEKLSHPHTKQDQRHDAKFLEAS